MKVKYRVIEKGQLGVVGGRNKKGGCDFTLH